MSPSLSNLLSFAFEVPPRNVDFTSMNIVSSLKPISLTEDTFLSTTGLMILQQVFLVSASMNDLSRWIVGFSRCKSKLNLVKIHMAHWLNTKAGSKSGFENQSFKRQNRSSLKSSLTKYKRKLGNFYQTAL